MSGEIDPVLKHSRREAIIIGVAWLISTIYCCAYCYWGRIYPRRAAAGRGGREADFGDAVLGVLGNHGSLAVLLALYLLVRRILHGGR